MVKSLLPFLRRKTNLKTGFDRFREIALRAMSMTNVEALFSAKQILTLKFLLKIKIANKKEAKSPILQHFERILKLKIYPNRNDLGYLRLANRQKVERLGG